MQRFVPNRWWLLAFGVVAIASGARWLADDRTLFSTGPVPETRSDSAFDELFAPTGVLDGLGRVEGIDRGFRLGLLPSEFGLGLVSVSTLWGAVGLMWLISSARRPSGASHRDRCRRPGCPEADDR